MISFEDLYSLYCWYLLVLCFPIFCRQIWPCPALKALPNPFRRLIPGLSQLGRGTHLGIVWKTSSASHLEANPQDRYHLHAHSHMKMRTIFAVHIPPQVLAALLDWRQLILNAFMLDKSGMILALLLLVMGTFPFACTVSESTLVVVHIMAVAMFRSLHIYLVVLFQFFKTPHQSYLPKLHEFLSFNNLCLLWWPWRNLVWLCTLRDMAHSDLVPLWWHTFTSL